MKKMKTYRLEESTLEQIQSIKKHYKEKGFDISDAGIIQVAISVYMDLAANHLKGEKE